jgi:predicted tellurium resistance membrane protein TerC
VEYLLTSEGLVALLTLTTLEIVLGIDNIIFVSILVGKLPADRQATARTVGLTLALVFRLMFLAAASWIAGLTQALFQVPAVLSMDAPFDVSGRDLIMFTGGLFLLTKATTELYNKLEGYADDHRTDDETKAAARRLFGWMIVQIILLDIVFSIDSVITAVGLTTNFPVMAIAVIIAVGVMLLAASRISAFIEQHPSIKILALAFLLMVGMVLVLEGFHVHIPKGYVYFSMAFSVLVEAFNMRFRRRRVAKAVELRSPSFDESTSKETDT